MLEFYFLILLIFKSAHLFYPYPLGKKADSLLWTISPFEHNLVFSFYFLPQRLRHATQLTFVLSHLSPSNEFQAKNSTPPVFVAKLYSLISIDYLFPFLNIMRLKFHSFLFPLLVAVGCLNSLLQLSKKVMNEKLPFVFQ